MTENCETGFPIGSRVRHKTTGECGVVVHSWYDSSLMANDYYIAFFGKKYPDGKPERVPYVLRYLDSSLEAVDV